MKHRHIDVNLEKGLSLKSINDIAMFEDENFKINSKINKIYLLNNSIIIIFITIFFSIVIYYYIISKFLLDMLI